MSTDRSLEALTAEDFRPHQGSRFRLSGGPSAVSLDTVLAEVTEHGEVRSGPFRAPFSVVFNGPLQPVAPQGIYRVEHEKLGTLDLFVVPVGPDEPAEPGQAPRVMRYEAVFG